MIRRSTILLLCHKKNMDGFLSRNEKVGFKPILAPLGHQVLITSKDNSQGEVEND